MSPWVSFIARAHCTRVAGLSWTNPAISTERRSLEARTVWDRCIDSASQSKEKVIQGRLVWRAHPLQKAQRMGHPGFQRIVSHPLKFAEGGAASVGLVEGGPAPHGM